MIYDCFKILEATSLVAILKITTLRESDLLSLFLISIIYRGVGISIGSGKFSSRAPSFRKGHTVMLIKRKIDLWLFACMIHWAMMTRALVLTVLCV